MKHKAKVRDLTNGEFFSLQDASEELKIPKNEVYNAAKAAGMDLGLLFSKYTVFTANQVRELKLRLHGG